MENAQKQSDRLINLQEVIAITAVSRSQIYNLMKHQDFPASLSLSYGKANRCSRWSFNEVIDWIEQKKMIGLNKKRSIEQSHDSFLRSYLSITPDNQPKTNMD